MALASNICDRKFAIIENQQKKVEKIEMPSEWIDLIKNAKQTDWKFQMVEMHASNFVRCEELLRKFCTNRKKTLGKNDLNWLTFRKIGYKKPDPLVLFFETYDDVSSKFDEQIEFKPDLIKAVSIRKRGIKIEDFVEMQLPVLFPDGNLFQKPKKVDLLDFISLKYHKFYTNQRHENEQTDEDFEAPDDLIVISDDDENEN